MKIALFSDVHGNYMNLLSFYESTKQLGIDQYICLGDLCNYYPDNKKVILFMRENNISCILGNHDEFYLRPESISTDKKKAYNFDEALLDSTACIDYLKELPLKLDMTFGERSALFCHASPFDLQTYIYPDTDFSVYDLIPYNFIFMGHTHRQFLRSHKNKIFCNVGSIGLPRDNGALMSFATFDTESLEIMLYRKEINVEELEKTYAGRVNQDVLNVLSRKENLTYKYTLLHE